VSRAQGWDPIVGELVDYFRSADSVNGLSSSWTPLVGIAMGGAVTTKDPESRVVDGRFGRRPGTSVVDRFRDTRRALVLLPPGDPSDLDVLWGAHGPVRWPRIVKAGLGEETEGKLAEFLDERLFGVALLTPEFRAGVRGWTGPTPVRKDDKRGKVRAWHAPGAWLADLALVAKSRSGVVSEERRAHAVATLSEVGRSATKMLRASEDAYRVLRGAVPAPPAEPRTRRSRRLEGLEGIDFMTTGERR
jgi:hypothetical protein